MFGYYYINLNFIIQMHVVTYSIVGLSRLCYLRFVMNSIDIGLYKGCLSNCLSSCLRNWWPIHTQGDPFHRRNEM